MRINNNLMAMNTHRQLGIGNAGTAKSMEKLSSGFRINRAGDDAAGLAISEKMRGQIRGLNQASRNAQDSISMIQTAEGALGETHAILQRMRELALQSSNDTNTVDDRKEIQKEINQLTSEINRIGNTTEFNTKKLINGDMNVAQDADMHKVTVAFDAGFTAATAHNNVVLTIGGTDYTIVFDETKAKNSVTAADVVKASNTITVGIQDAVDDIAADIAAGLQLLQGQTPQSDLAQFTISGAGNTLTIEATETGKYAGAAGKDSITLKEGLLAEKLSVAVEGDDGSAGPAQMQIGANTSQQFEIKILDMRSKALGIAGDAEGLAGANGAKFAKDADNQLTDVSADGTPEYALDVSSAEKATQAVTILDNAIKDVSAERSKLGAYQNRLEHTIKNLDTSSENLQAAESRIRDVDMAKEMMNFTKNNILQQAAQAMLAQANQAPQGVLQLLR